MKHLQILIFKHTFQSQDQFLYLLIKRIKNDYNRDQQAKG